MDLGSSTDVGTVLAESYLAHVSSGACGMKRFQRDSRISSHQPLDRSTMIGRNARLH